MATVDDAEFLRAYIQKAEKVAASEANNTEHESFEARHERSEYGHNHH